MECRPAGPADALSRVGPSHSFGLTLMPRTAVARRPAIRLLWHLTINVFCQSAPYGAGCQYPIGMGMCHQTDDVFSNLLPRRVASVELQPARQMPGGSSFNEVLGSDLTVSDIRRAPGSTVAGGAVGVGAAVGGSWSNCLRQLSIVIGVAELSLATGSPRSAEQDVAAWRWSGVDLCI